MMLFGTKCKEKEAKATATTTEKASVQSSASRQIASIRHHVIRSHDTTSQSANLYLPPSVTSHRITLQPSSLLVITNCSESPPPSGSLSPLSTQVSRWGLLRGQEAEFRSGLFGVMRLLFGITIMAPKFTLRFLVSRFASLQPEQPSVRCLLRVTWAQKVMCGFVTLLNTKSSAVSVGDTCTQRRSRWDSAQYTSLVMRE
mmetsp:Transcript_20777/g.57731  ORF Transcript_20777/g.57731 Transcript_20777/m.57731 type:complete len:200 (-) Transcript_20777:39-638(-)